jgi:hypothetical protein
VAGVANEHMDMYFNVFFSVIGPLQLDRLYLGIGYIEERFLKMPRKLCHRANSTEVALEVTMYVWILHITQECSH